MDFETINLVVEREWRKDSVELDFVYRVTVRSRFSTASEKGWKPTQHRKDKLPDSKVLIMGPYARTVDKAMAAGEKDLMPKLKREVHEDRAIYRRYLVARGAVYSTRHTAGSSRGVWRNLGGCQLRCGIARRCGDNDGGRWYWLLWRVCEVLLTLF